MLFSAKSTLAKEVSKEQQRADVRKMAQDTLSRLYDIQPAVKKAPSESQRIEASKGGFRNSGQGLGRSTVKKRLDPYRKPKGQAEREPGVRSMKLQRPALLP